MRARVWVRCHEVQGWYRHISVSFQGQAQVSMRTGMYVNPSTCSSTTDVGSRMLSRLTLFSQVRCGSWPKTRIRSCVSAVSRGSASKRDRAGSSSRSRPWISCAHEAGGHHTFELCPSWIFDRRNISKVISSLATQMSYSSYCRPCKPRLPHRNKPCNRARDLGQCQCPDQNLG